MYSIIYISILIMEQILTPAEKMYQNHLKNVKTYQAKNPEKMKLKQKKYITKMKEDDPDKYCLLLEKKKQYYKNKKNALKVDDETV